MNSRYCTFPTYHVSNKSKQNTPSPRMLNMKGSHTGTVVPLFILLMVLKNTPHLKENYCHNWRIVRKKQI